MVMMTSSEYSACEKVHRGDDPLHDETHDEVKYPVSCNRIEFCDGRVGG